MFLRRTRLSLALVLTMALSVSVGSAQANADGETRTIQVVGTTSIAGGSAGSDAVAWPEFPTAEGADAEDADQSGIGLVNRPPDADLPGPAGSAGSGKHAKSNPELLLSFNGLNHRDQRTANGGNQFSLEPPDQGLCVGAGRVVESVNDVLRVFDIAGTAVTGVTDLNTFYGYPAAINRTTGVRGPFITDPSCLFDAQTQRFYHVVLTLDTFSNGAFTGRNHLDIAVSNTSDPTGTWTIYRLPVQNDGTEGTPNHHCLAGPGSATATHPTACLGDFPHVGADANGFFITTNEFDFFGPNRRAAQIYAFSKRALASGAATVAVTQFDTTGLQSGSNGFTVWPATTPDGAFADDLGGTEYFVSSFRPAIGGTSNRLAVWALTNTASLDTTPALNLMESPVLVQSFSRPPRSNQKAGNFPLGQCLNDPTCRPNVVGGTGPTEVEGQLDSSDARVLTNTFANGKLWAALGTGVSVGGAAKAGIAWFVLKPQISAAGVTARVALQGTLAMAGNNLIYPEIGVTPNGRGVMGFTLTGDDFFPSAAYAPIDALAGVGDIHVIAAGLGPQDGFTEYKAFGGPTPRPRWGDYGSMAVDGNTVWVANEYIAQTCTLAQYRAAPFGSCSGTRTSLGNWGTRVGKLKP